MACRDYFLEASKAGYFTIFFSQKPSALSGQLAPTVIYAHGLFRLPRQVILLGRSVSTGLMIYLHFRDHRNDITSSGKFYCSFQPSSPVWIGLINLHRNSHSIDSLSPSLDGEMYLNGIQLIAVQSKSQFIVGLRKALFAAAYGASSREKHSHRIKS